jgi:UDP-N-acetyl-D-mannosaminuronate dehydrogenase
MLQNLQKTVGGIDIMKWYTICIGTGEIGKPLYELLSGSYRTLPVDPLHYPENQGKIVDCDFMHICIPGEMEHFDKVILDYIHHYEPDFVFIHSTVVPGTCKRLQKQTKVPIMSSPVHGKHHNNQMKKDMLRYPKYVGLPEGSSHYIESVIREHLAVIGFADIRISEGTDNIEWLKVLSTTYFGLIIAWHQEIERICDEFNLEFDKVIDIFKYQDDIKPPHYSGVVGGHCVMQNIKMIKEIWPSDLLDWIERSNELKLRRK